MSQRPPAWLLSSLASAAVVSVALATRPPLPVDETRYLAVAWEMWKSGDFLVPHLNGETYSHKPPLLFWLMNLGWSLFDVNAWTPRLVAPLFAVGSLFLTARLARQLWPERPETAALAPWILFGCGFWTLFTTLTMFDMMLAFFALAGTVGVVDAWRGRRVRGFAVLALAVGLGVLSKGPAILLHLLPVALTAPWWGCGSGVEQAAGSRSLAVWYLGLLGAIVAGAALALAWALPAGAVGGEAYRKAILWGQSAGRVVESFAHRRVWWWYLAVFPGLVVPWILWPAYWRAVRDGLLSTLGDGGVRLCLVWFVSAFAVFSLISGKQLHYLLPEFPAFALLSARWLADGAASAPPSRLDKAVIGGLALLFGSVLIGLEIVALPLDLPVWLPLFGGWWGLLPVIVGVLIAVCGWSRLGGAVPVAALVPAVAVVAVHLAAQPALRAVYDLRPIAQHLKRLERDGAALANFGKYHGQYHFLGRLDRPIAVIGLSDGDEQRFLADHPTGRIVAYYETLPEAAEPLATYVFREKTVAIWPARTLIDFPGIGERR